MGSVKLHRVDLMWLSPLTPVVRSGSVSQVVERAHSSVGSASGRISNLEAATATSRNGTYLRPVPFQAVEFFNVLASAALLQTTESALPEHRERSPTRCTAKSPAGTRFAGLRGLVSDRYHQKALGCRR